MNHHWQVLGWTLVHFLWQGAAIALVYRVVDLVLARRSANARYVVALAALLGMVAVSLTTLAYEEASLHPSDLSTGSAARVVWTSVPLASVRAAAASATPPHTVDRFLVDRVLPVLDVVWFAGVLLLTLRALGGWWLLRRLRLSPLHPAPHTLLLRLDVMRLQMGIRHFIDLRLSSRIASPFTAGVLRPWILLPIAALTHLSPEQIEVVLSHELAHIRRRDYLWNILQTVVETLFFFHPAVWWISRRAREERELCCDDAALVRCPDPSVYASALLRLEEQRRNHLRLAMALDGHRSRAGLRARILRILGDADPSPRSLRPLSLAGTALAVAIFFCPMPKVFAGFRAVPQAAASLTHKVSLATHAIHAPAAAFRQTVPEPPPARAPAPVQAKPSPDGPGPPPAADENQNQDQDQDHSDYIDQMRGAGYNVDIDKYVAMRVQGVTPAYAREMAQALGTQLTAEELISAKVQGITSADAAAIAKSVGSSLTIRDLISMKVEGITPDYIAQMKAAGYELPVHQLIAMKVQDITPDYAEQMAKVGFGKPTAAQLIALRVQRVTPDYAAKLRAAGIDSSSFNELISDRIFQVTPEFVVQMKDAGFPSIAQHQLIALRVQGVTPDFARSVKAQFPDATVNDLVQMRVFHIDSAFIASAQRHGFAQLTLQKLIRLRISGVLDDAKDARENQP
ncbi:MAG TPA: M56 family metallopeptidase [Acidobacteriaceae bacterium]|jgi:beta-lactamase regulating signal transducer with metallopeptidase domain|nr:M56 family metallopeptidase [Acidobacteriaceae bacterium]